LQRYVYPFADAIIAVSSDLADALSKSARLARSQIKVIFNPAFDERQLASSEPPPHPWLEDRAVPVIVGAGRFRPQKDFSTFLKVVAKVSNQRPVRAVLLGDGEQADALRQQAESLGLSDNVLFPGFVSDVSPWLRGADIFLMTSRWEGFGNILVQALAARCSVVSTSCPDGPSEILDKGRFGLLAPVGDVEALTDAVLTVLDRPFEPQAQYERACQFTVTRSTDQYEALFGELVRKATQP
jgi:glycosyltransferase involved in cell wall biosynthesis